MIDDGSEPARGRTLGGFIDRLERERPSSVLRVTETVPVEKVITATVMELQDRRQYPLVVFESVAGYDQPVVTNVFATRERIARAIGVSESAFFETWNDRISDLTPVKQVQSGPVMATTRTDDDVDVTTLPAPLHFDGDGGRYITAGIVVAKDPEAGINNLSFARIQLKTPRKAGISIHSRGDLWEYVRKGEQMGQTMDVAVIVGAHPDVYVGASANLGIDVDEYEVVGAMRGRPLKVVPCETVDLAVPAEAELIIEGTIDPTEHEPEGPFGEYTGVMSGRSSNNVLRIDAISHREAPRFLSIVPGQSREHLQLGRAPKEPTIHQKIKDENAYLQDIHFPHAGTHYHCFMSIDKSAPGQPQQTILSALGAWRYIKLAVVVDTDVDVTDVEDVLWAVATRVQPDEDVFTLPKATGNPLDPSSVDGATAKMGIDATQSVDSDIDRLTIDDDATGVAVDILDAHGY
jgi:UbiD family decarboxylase